MSNPYVRGLSNHFISFIVAIISNIFSISSASNDRNPAELPMNCAMVCTPSSAVILSSIWLQI